MTATKAKDSFENKFIKVKLLQLSNSDFPQERFVAKGISPEVVELILQETDNDEAQATEMLRMLVEHEDLKASLGDSSGKPRG